MHTSPHGRNELHTAEGSETAPSGHHYLTEAIYSTELQSLDLIQPGCDAPVSASEPRLSSGSVPPQFHGHRTHVDQRRAVGSLTSPERRIFGIDCAMMISEHWSLDDRRRGRNIVTQDFYEDSAGNDV